MNLDPTRLNSWIVAQVNAAGFSRVYPMRAPKEAKAPFVIYQQVFSGSESSTLERGPEDSRPLVYEFRSYSRIHSSAIRVRENLKNKFDGSVRVDLGQEVMLDSSVIVPGSYNETFDNEAEAYGAIMRVTFNLGTSGKYLNEGSWAMPVPAAEPERSAGL